MDGSSPLQRLETLFVEFDEWQVSLGIENSLEGVKMLSITDYTSFNSSNCDFAGNFPKWEEMVDTAAEAVTQKPTERSIQLLEKMILIGELNDEIDTMLCCVMDNQHVWQHIVKLCSSEFPQVFALLAESGNKNALPILEKAKVVEKHPHCKMILEEAIKLLPRFSNPSILRKEMERIAQHSPSDDTVQQLAKHVIDMIEMRQSLGYYNNIEDISQSPMYGVEIKE